MSERLFWWICGYVVGRILSEIKEAIHEYQENKKRRRDK